MNGTTALGVFSIQTIWAAVLRHKTRALAAFLLVAGSVAVVTFLMPKTYRSEGKLFVRLGRENATLDSTAAPGQEPVVAVPASRDGEINSVVEILQSHSLAEKVVDAVGVDAILGSPAGAADNSMRHDQAIRRLGKDLDVAAGKKSNIIHLAYRARSPEVAQKVLTTLIDSFQDEYIRLNRQSGAMEFFVKQAERSQSELTKKEAELRDLKTAAGVVVLLDQQQVVVKRLGHIQDQLLEAETARAVAQRRVETFRQELEGLSETRQASSTTGLGNEAADRMREQLYLLQIKKAEASAKYSSDHPELKRVEEQLASAKAIFERQQATRTQIITAPNRLFEETRLCLLQEEPVLASLEARAAALRSQLVETRTELKTLNENELRIAKLQREVEAQQTSCKKYLASLEQARIDQALEARRMSNISIVQSATHDLQPIRPQKALCLALGLVAGLIASAGAVLVGEYRGQTFHPVADLPWDLETPAAGSTPSLHEQELIGSGNGHG
jgi:uncharacterized protein involved in exopolysaccharide biosynthesis